MGEAYSAVAGLGSCVAMALCAVMSLLDFELSQSVVLLLGGLLCLEGEWSSQQQFMHSYSAFVQDYFGFAMVPLGRAVAYALAALHCMGVRATTDHAVLYRSVWYL